MIQPDGHLEESSLDLGRLAVPALRAASSPGLAVVEFLPDASTARDHELEALWYELSHPTFGPLGLVPVMPLVGRNSVMMVAARLAAIGASVSRQPVIVIDGTRVVPAEAETAVDHVTQTFESQHQCIVVAQSPTVEPGSIPLLEVCDRAVLVVRLGSSRRSEVDLVEEMLPRTPVVGAVCLPVVRRRAQSRRRRRDRLQSDQPSASTVVERQETLDTTEDDHDPSGAATS